MHFFMRAHACHHGNVAHMAHMEPALRVDALFWDG
jgi:hypothetical protein